MLLPGFARCWAENMRLVCNDQGTECSSPPGVVTTVTDHARAVDPIGLFPVFGPLVSSLQGHGYTLGNDMIVHAYDTRTTPLAHMGPNGSFATLKARIEHLAEDRGVVIVAAGLGARYLSLFLQSTVDQAWTAAHVQMVVSVSGVWGGAPWYALSMLGGYWGGWGTVLTKSVVQRLAAYTPSLQVLFVLRTCVHAVAVVVCG